jgi:GT2 family glycosyltransferase/glycosyltransferase involved in cell wall biosynthesis
MSMRAKDYKTAIELYEAAIDEFPLIREQILFNIAIAKSHLKRSVTTGHEQIPIVSNTSQAVKSDFSYNLTAAEGTVPFGVRGHIDVVDENFIHGWIYDVDSPSPLELVLYYNGCLITSTTADIIRNDVLAAGGIRAACGFKIEHGSFTRKLPHAKLSIGIANNNNALAFAQFVETSRISANTEILSGIAQYIKRQYLAVPSDALNWLSNIAIPELMQNVRNNSLPLGVELSKSTLPAGPREIDVIVPVYEGLDETLNCINSVLTSQNEHAYNLIVINDCSPNQTLSKELKLHSKKNNYTLLENEINLGFVGTVNRGILGSLANDVILLNSDTLVPNGWLDQLAATAYSDAIIGTVTPFSNNATICSFPNFCQDNDLPDGETVESLNRKFRETNDGLMLDIPTAHGFCMFIKRSLIQEIGIFDEKKWGKGYAEENDFSLRADKHGWRNVMALDTFVQHLGSVSFASNTEDFIKNNLKILNGIYPDYPSRVAKFIQEDPARTFRNNVSRKILIKEIGQNPTQTNKRKSILFVTLTIGGGTQIATDDIAAQLERESVDTIYLTCPSKDTWRVSRPSGNANINYSMPGELSTLLSDLKLLNIWHVNYHNTIEFDKSVWDIHNLVSCDYDVTVHDYLSICPRVNLIDSTQKYCGEPTVAVCNTCIERNGVHESSHLNLTNFDNDVGKWRAFFGGNLSRARKVFVPSNDVARRLEKYFPDVGFSVKPHPEALQSVTLQGPAKGPVINVAFVGAIGIHKGYDYLIGCADFALAHKLPIKFHVVGYTRNDVEAKLRSNIVVHGKYSRPELATILKKSKCNIAAILSVWPETFSYTFSEAISAGLKVIAFDLGAPAERLQPGSGELVGLNESYEEICKKIIRLSKTPKIKISIGTKYDDYLSDYFHFQNV